MNKLKKSSIVGIIICALAGICLILTGIFCISTYDDKTFEYEQDYNSSGTYYEFEIDTRQKLNVDSAKAKIKVAGKTEKVFEIYLDNKESDVEDGEYVFVTLLLDENSSVLNKVVEIEVLNLDGDKVIYKPESFASDVQMIMLVVVPVLLGIIFLILAFVMLVGKKEQNEKNDNNSVQKSADEINVQPESKYVTCKYCGIQNEKTNAKCENCGAPLIKN